MTPTRYVEPGTNTFPPAPAEHSSHPVLRADRHDAGYVETDELAQEIPVALEFNGISHATLLASPTDLEDLAFGFSFTEGIIRSARDIHEIDVVAHPEGLIIRTTIASACLHRLKLRRRSLAGRTGCGLCGIESLNEVRRRLCPVRASRGFDAQAICRATAGLRARQPLYTATGATHAAGWASESGAVEHVREDVGRHNALDKLIGHLLRNSIDTANGMAIISSRASFEMVQKAASAGIPALVAVSAPTTFAVRLADELNVMLAGFSRGDKFTVYTHPEYLSERGSPS